MKLIKLIAIQLTLTLITIFAVYGAVTLFKSTAQYIIVALIVIIVLVGYIPYERHENRLQAKFNALKLEKHMLGGQVYALNEDIEKMENKYIAEITQLNKAIELRLAMDLKAKQEVGEPESKVKQDGKLQKPYEANEYKFDIPSQVNTTEELINFDIYELPDKYKLPFAEPIKQCVCGADLRETKCYWICDTCKKRVRKEV